jgi:hypothetical protein
MTSVARTIRRIVAALLLFVSLTVQHDTRTDASGVTTELRLGAWFSPWYTRTEVTHETTAPAADGGTITSASMHTTVNVTMASWSWPILAAGLALLLWPTRKTAY